MDSPKNLVADISRIIQEISNTHDIAEFTALAVTLRTLYSACPYNPGSAEGAEVERKLACATMMWLYVFVQRFESAVLSEFCASKPRSGGSVPSVPRAYKEYLDLALEAVQYESPPGPEGHHPVRRAVELLLGFVPTSENQRSEPCSYYSDTQGFLKHVEVTVPALMSGATIPRGTAISSSMSGGSNTPTLLALLQDASCHSVDQISDAVIHAPTPRRHPDYSLVTEFLFPPLNNRGRQSDVAEDTGKDSGSPATPKVEEEASSSSLPKRIENSPHVEMAEAPKGNKRKPRATKKAGTGKQKRTGSERNPNKENVRDGPVA